MRQAPGWRLEGTAAFRHEDGTAACVSYAVECDEEWRTRIGEVRGWVGAYGLNLHLCRVSNGPWILNDQVVDGLDGCVDLDLGFTPATNLFQLRRMALQVGQAAEISVAWLDVPDGGLEVLRQRYERRSAEEYDYQAPQFEYAAHLRVSPAGFVVKYPGLWEAESTGTQRFGDGSEHNGNGKTY
ncbi:putative glycolipid-binding domain-containing protein [Alkalilimnicola ehrlichii]|uniref:putative glycolipid-binding domain-containing protein n=1 Tax=Alkalilimnicola ehrlichii TaxID=351052 RepID=UPI001C6EF583|nr:putative glycolipid-binding domain-containing protein [Alkalilimnicola ehrlichii]